MTRRAAWRWAAAWALALLAGCAPAPTVPPKPGPTAAELRARQAAEATAAAQAALDARVAEAVRIADEAYLYGYPLMLGEMHRLLMSNVAKAAGLRAPANSFWHARRPAGPGERHALADDPDTLASVAWLDLGREAMLITTPEMGRRWFAVALHSQWMPALATMGSGTGDVKPARWLVSGPDWQGTVPAGARHVRSPTRHALLWVRVQTSGTAADLRAVQALQSRLRIVPQTVRGKGAAAPAPALPPDPVGDSAVQALQALDTAAYFDRLAALLGTSAPPAAADAPVLERMARIGLQPGQPWRIDALEPAVQAALAGTVQRAQQRLQAEVPKLFADNGGWLLPLAEGADDPARRAAFAYRLWPGPQPRQLLELHAAADAAGRALSGAHDYRLAFAKGQLPPVDGFWSLTLRADDARASFVPNSAERFSLGTRDKLPAAADGTLELMVQNLSPGADDAARWLPAPKGGFVLTLRLYAPRVAPPSALPPGRGNWAPPALQRLD